MWRDTSLVIHRPYFLLQAAADGTPMVLKLDEILKTLTEQLNKLLEQHQGGTQSLIIETQHDNESFLSSPRPHHPE